MRVMAIPTLKDKTIERIKSWYSLKAFRRASIRAPAAVVKIKAPSIGFIPEARARVTPARELWERVSPMREYLLSTKNKPIEGQRIPIKKETIKAFCIKPY